MLRPLTLRFRTCSLLFSSVAFEGAIFMPETFLHHHNSRCNDLLQHPSRLACRWQFLHIINYKYSNLLIGLRGQTPSYGIVISVGCVVKGRRPLQQLISAMELDTNPWIRYPLMKYPLMKFHALCTLYN